MERFVRKLIELGTIESLKDAFDLVREIEVKGAYLLDGKQKFNEESFSKAHEMNREIRGKLGEMVRKGNEKALRLYKASLRMDAPYDFDCFLRYIEFECPRDRQFYAPRRNYLRPIVEAYQEVLDRKLRLLTISMPKRAGKSQLGILFTLMVSGRNPNGATLMEGVGDDLVGSFYQGCLEYLNKDTEYAFYEIFPTLKVSQTNADTKIINLDKRSRFPTIMCRSIDSRQVGLSEATNLLYLDDCVEGYVEAKNHNRLEEKWKVISGDVMGRAVEGTPIVCCGTRYSVKDPIAHLQDEASKQGWVWKSIEIPALDPVTDESNYEYYNPKTERMTFTTQYFREQRDLLSEEQFASEFQQQPFESKGQLFPEKRLNRYFALPKGDPDGVIAVCDPSQGKGDSTMMPIAYLYGDDVFIEDCVFSNATPEYTKPLCAKKLFEHKVSRAMFESNAAGEYFARDVEEILNGLGGKCSFKTKYSTANKNTRIELASDGILKHFYFKDSSKYDRNSQYAGMIRELCNYTRTGKVLHDDAPDGLAMLENELRNVTVAKIMVKTRFW